MSLSCQLVSLSYSLMTFCSVAFVLFLLKITSASFLVPKIKYKSSPSHWYHPLWLVCLGIICHETMLVSIRSCDGNQVKRCSGCATFNDKLQNLVKICRGATTFSLKKHDVSQMSGFSRSTSRGEHDSRGGSGRWWRNTRLQDFQTEHRKWTSLHGSCKRYRSLKSDGLCCIQWFNERQLILINDVEHFILQMKKSLL